MRSQNDISLRAAHQKQLLRVCSFRRKDGTGYKTLQRRGSGPSVQPDERVCIPWGKLNHSADLSTEIDRRMRNAWCSFRKYTLEQYDRPSAPLELKIRMLRAEVTRDNAVRLRHVEPARVPLRHTAPSPPQVLDSLHRLAKAQSCRPPDFLSGHAYQDGK